jgi:hypothetical protein
VEHEALPEKATSCLSSTSLDSAGRDFSLGLRFVIDKDHLLSGLSSSEKVPVQSSVTALSVEVGTGWSRSIPTEGLKSSSDSKLGLAIRGAWGMRGGREYLGEECGEVETEESFARAAAWSLASRRSFIFKARWTSS